MPLGSEAGAPWRVIAPPWVIGRAEARGPRW